MTRKEAKIRRAVFIGAVLAVGVAVCSSFAKKPVEYETISVGIVPGDTLWSIATEYKPEGMDTRDYIQLMYELNEGLTPNIQPGTGIVVPIC